MQGVGPVVSVSEFLARRLFKSMLYMFWGEKSVPGSIVLTDRNNLSNLVRGSPKGKLWQMALK